jgi:nickel-dependent lactate racemase
MVWAASKVKLAFILNVVINSNKEIIGAFAGDFNKAHLAGVAFLEDLCVVAPVCADIVITSNNGYPLDQNIYQTVKGIKTAGMTCNPGGVIIMASRCEDGSGGSRLYEIFKNDKPVEKILSEIEAVPADKTYGDQWQAQELTKVLIKHSVIFVSEAGHELVKHFRMTPADTIDEALLLAEAMLDNKSAAITVIPEGISVVIK